MQFLNQEDIESGAEWTMRVLGVLVPLYVTYWWVGRNLPLALALTTLIWLALRSGFAKLGRALRARDERALAEALPRHRARREALRAERARKDAAL